MKLMELHAESEGGKRRSVPRSETVYRVNAEKRGVRLLQKICSSRRWTVVHLLAAVRGMTHVPDRCRENGPCGLHAVVVNSFSGRSNDDTATIITVAFE